MMDAQVEYVSGGLSSLDRIGPLWHELKEYNALICPYFSELILAQPFSGRKEQLIHRAGHGAIHVDLACHDGHDIGYCVATIDDTAETGTIDSLFVKASHRGQKIGTRLVEKAWSWFDARKIAIRTVDVFDGNSEACRFLARFGFKTQRSTMIAVKRS